MREPLPDDAALAKLEKLAHDFSAAPVSAAIHESGHSRIVAAAFARKFPQRAPTRIGIWAAPAMAVAAVLLGVVWFATRIHPLTYEVIGGSRFESGYLSANPSQPAQVRFSDGSSLEATPGTQIRVDATHEYGARVLVERGQIIAQIHHGRTSTWQFVAGPFAVQVVGTRFRLSWDPAQEELDLLLDEGAVEVRSPLGQGPFLVRQGQHFNASLLTRSVRMDDASVLNQPIASPSTAVPAATIAEPPLPSSISSSNHDAPAATSAPHALPVVKNKPDTAPPESWPVMVSRGRFKSVIDAANERGVDGCLNSCSLTDLRALADAARYASQSDLSRRSLMAIRKRASSNMQRASAGFLLGRLSESLGQLAVANSWYETCLTEFPNGDFAADALAGRMRLTLQGQGIAAARPIAEQYLLRYPNGVHRDRARQISEGK